MKSYVYPGIVERGDDGGYGLHFPDLPGCVTAVDALDALAGHAREALQLHLTGMAEDGLAFPAPSAMDSLPRDPEVNEFGVLLVEANLDGPAQSVSVALPDKLIARIDKAARERGVTRDDLIAEGAEALLKAG